MRSRSPSGYVVCLVSPLLIALLVSCARRQSVPSAPMRPAVINHVVFFKLQDPADADVLLADCESMLGQIPGVVALYAGRHIETGRPTVDSNYDVGIYVGFMDEAAYAGYVEHPSHLELVKKWQPRLQWLRVYDVLDETP